MCPSCGSTSGRNQSRKPTDQPTLHPRYPHLSQPLSLQEVISHYKLSLSDTGTPTKAEWGPWIDEVITITDENGNAQIQKVQRTDPKGVKIMKKYPDFDFDPGLDDWIPAAERVPPPADKPKERSTPGWNQKKCASDSNHACART